ncbi:MAG: 4Fe-4S binding protein [Methanobrevibacter sp.]|nr:4Fe-4S binding protein [Methanobrevibacter sp.]
MKINISDCGICESCIEVCPQGIIKKKGYKVVIQEGCDECGECMEVCPVGAIQSEDKEK